MAIGVVTQMSLGQPENMPSSWLGEPCHGAVGS